MKKIGKSDPEEFLHNKRNADKKIKIVIVDKSFFVHQAKFLVL